MAGWDDSIFSNLPPQYGALPGSPYRPQPPPSRGWQDLFPVDPRAVVGGLYQQGTEGAGNLVAGAARGVGLPNPDLLGHDVTGWMQSPVFGGGMSPMAGATTLAAAPLAMKAARGARTAEEAATGVRASDAADAAVRASQASPGQAALDQMVQAGQGPAVITHANPTSDDINAVMQSVATTKGDPWPTAQNPMFDASPEALARNNQTVAQTSYRDLLPRPDPGTTTLPLKGRAQQLVDARGQIADKIASDLQPITDPSNPNFRLTQFYSTSPVLEQLVKQGVLDPDEANQFMRDWAGQGAATSPRTATPQNMRNSSLLLYRRASGNPLDRAAWEAEGNAPGFPMMGMHVDLADQFAKGTENINTNPKPTMFREGWSGNQADVTGDTHNIRSTLYNFDQLNPGQLDPGWFTKQGYQDYRAVGGFKPGQPLNVGSIKDTLEGATKGGVYKQTEYGVMTDPWYDAAAKLGITPAGTQAGGWFNYGPITGLRSPQKILPDLLNDQLEHTSRVLGVEPQRLLDWWGKRKIPLAQNTAPGTTINSTAVG